MKKYSASYTNIKDNFVILNLDEGHRIDDDILYGLFCVIQNIIQRGKPTIPSRYIREALGGYDELSNEPIYLASWKDPKWNVIKGDELGLNYPAAKFYFELLPKYLGENNAVVRNLIIPEADFRDVLDRSTEFDGEQVDFYLPQLKIVFEIDGGQHRESWQSEKDKHRDYALQKAGNWVIRLTSDDIRNESDDLLRRMEELNLSIISDNLVGKLTLPFQRDDIENELKYETVMRFEILLLELLKSGRISLRDKTWYFNIISPGTEDADELFEFAFNDIIAWIKNLAQLLKINIAIPNISFGPSRSKKLVEVDIDLFSRYSDGDIQNGTIAIRNDYYPDRDYYTIATADPLQYSFTPEKREEDDACLKFLLNNIFTDIEEFRNGQPQIIKNVLERKTTIGILPTGTGKSLCYQIAAMLQPGAAIIVVPIISLMRDQKDSMEHRKIDHVNTISSEQSGEEKGDIMTLFQQGRYQFLWVAPERFQNVEFRETLIGLNTKLCVATAVIDEVHCLSEWGHDFRVSYLALVKSLRSFCPRSTLLGLTATASQAVLEDLKAEFEVDGDAVQALTNMDRQELIYHRVMVGSDSERMKKIYSIINEHRKPYKNKDGSYHDSIGLVFCPTVKGKTGCNKVLSSLQQQSEQDIMLPLRLATYNGQLSKELKAKIQDDFMEDKYDALMCTKAFGMGIDQPHIKYTIHDTMPQSIESFYQEAGRAGRDDDKSVESHCYILYNPELSSSKGSSVVQEIFNPNTDINRRKELSNQLNGDLSTIMWFWNNNKDTRPEEYSKIRKVLSFLYKGETAIAFDNRDGMSLEFIQSALYKLSILGAVSSWTIEYITGERGRVNVDYNGLDEDKMRQHLLAYINKYDPEFHIDEPSANYIKYYNLAHDPEAKPIARLVHVLIEWTNENIMNSRLQSTQNMMEWMDPSISDEEFRMRMNEFFKFSEESVIYNDIIYNPLYFDNWLELLFKRSDETKHRTDEIITIDTAKRRLAGLQRYLESYRHNTGMNYLSGILRLYTSTYEGTEGEWRLDEAFQNIQASMNPDEQAGIIYETLKFAGAFKIEEKDMLADVILRYFPTYIRTVYNSLKDRCSLSMLLGRQADRLSKIMEGME